MGTYRRYLPRQPGGSSLTGTWTGSPRRGARCGKARGVSEGHLVAGQNEGCFNVERGGVHVRQLACWAVFGEVQAVRLGVGVNVERRRGRGGRRG